jgi:hypothetical protein
VHRILNPLVQISQDLLHARALLRELTRKCVDVFAQTLLEAIEPLHFIFGAASRFVDNFTSSLLGRGREFTSLRFGFTLCLFYELVGHSNHRRHLFRRIGYGA